MLVVSCSYCNNHQCSESKTEGIACMCYVFLKYIPPKIAFSRSIFDFIIVSDVNTDAELLWSLLNGFIFLNEPLHRHALIWSQDVGIITTRKNGAILSHLTPSLISESQLDIKMLLFFLK